MGRPVVRQHFCQYQSQTAHSWQKLRPLKFYYGKSHFACSPAYMAIKTSWYMPGDLFSKQRGEQIIANHGSAVKWTDGQ